MTHLSITFQNSFYPGSLLLRQFLHAIEMPDKTGNMMSVCPRHKNQLSLEVQF